jgi:transcriptional regulator with XRE-family HTH domain
VKTTVCGPPGEISGRNRPPGLAQATDGVEAKDKLELSKANSMGKTTPVVPSRREALAQALRLLRRQRGRRPGEMALLMGISRRSYEYFEAGRGPLNVDRVHRFAQILDVDPFAILVAMEIRSPRFAVNSAEHKMATAIMVMLQDFDAAAGDDIRRLNAATIISVLTRALDALAKEAREGEAFAERWMEQSEPSATSSGPEVEAPAADTRPDPDVPAADTSPKPPDQPDPA